jgi:hypothetical protein
MWNHLLIEICICHGILPLFPILLMVFCCGFLWYIHSQQDPPGLTFARLEQIIKLCLGESGVASMSIFQEYLVCNKIFHIGMEKLAMKNSPILP